MGNTRLSAASGYAATAIGMSQLGCHNEKYVNRNSVTILDLPVAQREARFNSFILRPFRGNRWRGGMALRASTASNFVTSRVTA